MSNSPDFCNHEPFLREHNLVVPSYYFATAFVVQPSEDLVATIASLLDHGNIFDPPLEFFSCIVEVFCCTFHLMFVNI